MATAWDLTRVKTNTILNLARRHSRASHHEPQTGCNLCLGWPALRIAHGEDVPRNAAQALRILPPAVWPHVHMAAAAAALGLVNWAKTVPTTDRTSQDNIETVQLAGDLAASLPAPPSPGFQSELHSLRVPVFLIRTVREQMRYDTLRVVVTAGQPFEIRFENVDFMPHNLVLVRPGTREKIGLASAKMKPDELDRQGRAFIPQSTGYPGRNQGLIRTSPENRA